MRVGSVLSAVVYENRCRLTGGFHLSENQLASTALQRWNGNSDSLASLCLDGGLFRGPIFKRVFVEAGAGSRPYVSAKDLERLRVRPPNNLAAIHGPLLERLALHPETIVLTCSGMNLGTAIWVRGDMGNLCGTHDLIRVICNSEKIGAGYLYLFLASVYGRTAIRQQIYGGNIKHIEPEQMVELRVPRLAEGLEQELDGAVRSAFRMREDACRLFANAGSTLEERLGLPQRGDLRIRPVGSVAVAATRGGMRLDATYYSEGARWSDAAVKRVGGLTSLADAGVLVKETPRMKQIFAGEEYGVPFFTSSDIFKNDVSGERYLSRAALRNCNDWETLVGDVLVARSGQVGGIIGRCVWADERFDHVCVSPHVLRLRAKGSELRPGYIYAFLSETDVGYWQLIRLAAGSSVPFLDAGEVSSVRIPVAEDSLQLEVHGMIEEGGARLADAQALMLDAREKLTREIEEVL